MRRLHIAWAKCGWPLSASVSSPACHAAKWRIAQANGTLHAMPLAQFHAAYFSLPYIHTRVSSSKVESGMSDKSALPVLYRAPEPLAVLLTSPIPFVGCSWQSQILGGQAVPNSWPHVFSLFNGKSGNFFIIKSKWFDSYCRCNMFGKSSRSRQGGRLVKLCKQ